MTSFDPDKPIQTHNGAPARIICKDAGGPYPIIALVLLLNGDEEVIRCQMDGQVEGKHKPHYDLINVPARVERSDWHVVYSHTIGPASHTRELVEYHAELIRIKAILRVDWFSDGTRTYTEEPL